MEALFQDFYPVSRLYTQWVLPSIILLIYLKLRRKIARDRRVDVVQQHACGSGQVVTLILQVADCEMVAVTPASCSRPAPASM